MTNAPTTASALAAVAPTLIELAGLLGFAIILTNTLVTFLKHAIEVWVAPTDRPHDVLVQASALIVGVLSTLGLLLLVDASPSPRLVGGAGLLGVAVGFASMGNYALLTAALKLITNQPVANPPPEDPAPTIPA